MENQINSNVNFKEMLNNRPNLNYILHLINLEYTQIQTIVSSYEKDSNRFGVIFMAKNIKTENLQKIIIDAIDGKPNSTQVKEMTYDHGADCDKRIILYSLTEPYYSENEFGYEDEMVRRFAKVNNDCGFPTFLFQVSLASDKKTYEFDAEIYPRGKKWMSLKKLPTKQEFEQAVSKVVFRVLYNRTDERNGYDDDYYNDIDRWFSGACKYLDMYGIIFMFPVWDENGLFVQAKSITYQGADDLKSIRENNQKYLKKMFINREITFEIDFSGRVTMFIKLWDKPLSLFSKATYGDKEKIVDKFREVANCIDEYWGYLHYLNGSGNEYVEQYLAIPEDTFDELEKDISA